MLKDNVLAIADCTIYLAIPGFQDYTVAGQDILAVPEQWSANEDFFACDAECQLVHITRGTVFEVRYKQANSGK